MGLLLAAHAGATLFLVGVVWFVQLVHYPLYPAVGGGGFAAYERAHVRRTTRVVAPAMLVEAATGLALVLAVPPGLSRGLAVAGFVLLAVVWLSTLLAQAPCHRLLATGFDQVVARRLVETNWLRTAAWTVRGILALALVTTVAR